MKAKKRKRKRKKKKRKKREEPRKVWKLTLSMEIMKISMDLWHFCMDFYDFWYGSLEIYMDTCCGLWVVRNLTLE